MVLLFLLIAAFSAQIVSTSYSPPLIVPVQIINGTSSGICPSEAQLTARRLLTEDTLVALTPGLTDFNPVSSCSALPANSSTGFYWILHVTGPPPAVQMFCDFTEENPVSSCSVLPNNSPSGFYWILPATGQPAVQIFCDFTAVKISCENPVSSCSALPANSPSGFYCILPAAVQMYCDFNRQCGCEGASVWTRVAFFDMSDPNQVCPSAWTTITSPVRACGRGVNSGRGCNSVFYPTLGQTYNHVCGRVIAYQNSEAVAFYSLVIDGVSIEGHYVHGVSITHGRVGSRQHVWSFACAHGQTLNHPPGVCDCSNNNNWPYSTSFVGTDYFCDSGNDESVSFKTFNSANPLWDGQGCSPSSSCCLFNNPPWFCTTLPQPTADDLEVRICNYFIGSPSDVPVQLLEIYVQ